MFNVTTQGQLISVKCLHAPMLVLVAKDDLDERKLGFRNTFSDWDYRTIKIETMKINLLKKF